MRSQSLHGLQRLAIATEPRRRRRQELHLKVEKSHKCHLHYHHHHHHRCRLSSDNITHTPTSHESLTRSQHSSIQSTEKPPQLQRNLIMPQRQNQIGHRARTKKAKGAPRLVKCREFGGNIHLPLIVVGELHSNLWQSPLSLCKESVKCDVWREKCDARVNVLLCGHPSLQPPSTRHEPSAERLKNESTTRKDRPKTIETNRILVSASCTAHRLKRITLQHNKMNATSCIKCCVSKAHVASRILQHWQQPVRPATEQRSCRVTTSIWPPDGVKQVNR